MRKPPHRGITGNGNCATTTNAHSHSAVIITITPEEAAILKEVYERRDVYSPYEALEAFLDEAKVRFGEFPERLRRAVYTFQKYGNFDGGILLKGFPQDPTLPPTPVESHAAVRKDTHYSEFFLAAISSALGEPIGYAQEKHGEFWQSVNPTRANESKISSESSKSLLDFHTEVAFHPHMCDYVLLYGLRQEPERIAKTILCGIRRFYRRLPLRLQELLFQEVFKTGIDPSFGNDQETKGTGPALSILYGDRSDPFFRYDLDLMVGLTPAAQTALNELRVWVNSYKIDVTIEAGSLAIVDNRRCVHARSPFEAHYDGNDRWLERISVVKNLDASLLDRASGSRIINTHFSAFLD